MRKKKKNNPFILHFYLIFRTPPNLIADSAVTGEGTIAEKPPLSQKQKMK